MTVLAERTPLHVPPLFTFEDAGIVYAVDSDAPNWIATDARGGAILAALRGAEDAGNTALVRVPRGTLGG